MENTNVFGYIRYIENEYKDGILILINRSESEEYIEFDTIENLCNKVKNLKLKPKSFEVINLDKIL